MTFLTPTTIQHLMIIIITIITTVITLFSQAPKFKIYLMLKSKIKILNKYNIHMNLPIKLKFSHFLHNKQLISTTKINHNSTLLYQLTKSNRNSNNNNLGINHVIIITCKICIQVIIICNPIIQPLTETTDCKKNNNDKYIYIFFR